MTGEELASMAAAERERSTYGDSSASATIAEMDHRSGLSKVRRYSNRAWIDDGLTWLVDRSPAVTVAPEMEIKKTLLGSSICPLHCL